MYSLNNLYTTITSERLFQEKKHFLEELLDKDKNWKQMTTGRILNTPNKI